MTVNGADSEEMDKVIHKFQKLILEFIRGIRDELDSIDNTFRLLQH